MSDFKKTQLYWKGKDELGLAPSTEELRDIAVPNAWPAIIERLLKHYSTPKVGAVVWGDKTPAYLQHLSLLNDIFPTAKFVHIIRDPRDHALSERTVWGKSLLRSAHLWAARIEEARRAAKRFPDAYLEIRYEDLVSQTVETMTAVCQHVGIPFDMAVATPSRTSDALGKSQGLREVTASHVNRHADVLSLAQSRAIDAVVKGTAQSLDYAVAEDVVPRSVSALRLLALQAHDAAALTRFYVRTKGLRDGITYVFYSQRDRTV